MPVGGQSASVEITVDVFDRNNKIIKHYEAKADESAYSALYWGYSMYGANAVGDDYTVTKVAYLRAVSSALNNITRSIMIDIPIIKKSLMNN